MKRKFKFKIGQLVVLQDTDPIVGVAKITKKSFDQFYKEGTYQLCFSDADEQWTRESYLKRASFKDKVRYKLGIA